MKWRTFSILFWFLMAVFPACHSSSENLPPIKDMKDSELHRALKLKSGMKIVLFQRMLDLQSPQLVVEGFRTLTIDVPSGAEGLSLSWNSAAPEPQDGGSLEAPASPNPRVVFTEQVPPSNTDSGRLSLPNIVKSRKMTLPIFWPRGDLFLSNSSGVWLSDKAFEELRNKGKTQWQAGLLNNPLLGPAQEVPLIEYSLETLAKNLEASSKDYQKVMQIMRKKHPSKYPLKIDGKEKEVEVLEAGNKLTQFKILNNSLNPLVLQIQIAPEASVSDIIFSPLAFVKGITEYQVEEILSPSGPPVIKIR